MFYKYANFELKHTQELRNTFYKQAFFSIIMRGLRAASKYAPKFLRFGETAAKEGAEAAAKAGAETAAKQGAEAAAKATAESTKKIPFPTIREYGTKLHEYLKNPGTDFNPLNLNISNNFKETAGHFFTHSLPYNYLASVGFTALTNPEAFQNRYGNYTASSVIGGLFSKPVMAGTLGFSVGFPIAQRLSYGAGHLAQSFAPVIGGAPRLVLGWKNPIARTVGSIVSGGVHGTGTFLKMMGNANYRKAFFEANTLTGKNALKTMFSRNAYKEINPYISSIKRFRTTGNAKELAKLFGEGNVYRSIRRGIINQTKAMNALRKGKSIDDIIRETSAQMTNKGFRKDVAESALKDFIKRNAIQPQNKVVSKFNSTANTFAKNIIGGGAALTGFMGLADLSEKGTHKILDLANPEPKKTYLNNPYYF